MDSALEEYKCKSLGHLYKQLKIKTQVLVHIIFHHHYKGFHIVWEKNIAKMIYGKNQFQVQVNVKLYSYFKMKQSTRLTKKEIILFLNSKIAKFLQ